MNDNNKNIKTATVETNPFYQKDAKFLRFRALAVSVYTYIILVFLNL